MSLVRPLDRYVAREFVRIFLVTALGFPVLVFVVDLVDNLRKYTVDRQLPWRDIALSYWYYLPETIYMVLPAAVLFATVFTVGALTRHSELTAAKASGMSFHRVVRPIFVLAALIAGIGLFVGDLAPPANAVRNRLLRESCTSVSAQGGMGSGCNQSAAERWNFVFGGKRGMVYRVGYLNVAQGRAQNVEISAPGDSAHPALLLAAQGGQWSRDSGWILRDGYLHLIPDESSDMVVVFDSLQDRRFRETPLELRASEKVPEEMTFTQLSAFIETLENSGADVRRLRVERMLKLAIPVTSLVIALFGAPLATSTKRGGTAYGVAVSLGTTVVVLVLLQLTKAVGGSGVVSPELAAWLPNLLVGALALVLLLRVRT